MTCTEQSAVAFSIIKDGKVVMAETYGLRNQVSGGIEHSPILQLRIFLFQTLVCFKVDSCFV